MQKQQVPTAGLDDQPASISTSHCTSLALSHNPQAGPPSCHAFSFVPPWASVHPICPTLIHTHSPFS